MTKQLNDADVQAALDSLTEWERSGDEIKAQFVFADFRQAFGFMAEMSLWAEKLNHHPTWSNTYNRVDVALTTHDEGGITGCDIELATTMSAAFVSRS